MSIDEIDFVVSWVNGNDPRLNQLRLRYWQEQEQPIYPPSHNPPATQYANNNEIIYCLASILRNAKFVRRIHVITDQQKPPLEALLDFGFNETELAKISIVDHTLIFGNLIDLAPTFNSLSIESLIHRTPGLADHFVYMNDDFFILKETSPSDYFWAPKTPVIHAQFRPYSRTYHSIKQKLLDAQIRKKRVRWSFVDGCISAAIMSGLRFRYLQLEHSPLPMYRPILQDFFTANPLLLEENIRHRFRHHRQFLPQALASCLSFQCGSLKVKSSGNSVCYLKSNTLAQFNSQNQSTQSKKNTGHMPRAIKTSGETQFLCVQNLDQVNELERNTLLKFLHAALTQAS